jgi:hypothetical protein
MMFFVFIMFLVLVIDSRIPFSWLGLVPFCFVFEYIQLLLHFLTNWFPLFSS